MPRAGLRNLATPYFLDGPSKAHPCSRFTTTRITGNDESIGRLLLLLLQSCLCRAIGEAIMSRWSCFLLISSEHYPLSPSSVLPLSSSSKERLYRTANHP